MFYRTISRLTGASASGLPASGRYSTKFWRRPVLLLAGLLPAAVFAAAPLQGLSETELREARWYQVELIVFAHASPARNNPMHNDSEHWQTREGLHLPDGTVFLRFPQETGMSSEAAPLTTSQPLVAPTSLGMGNLALNAVPPANAAGKLPPLPAAFEVLPEAEWQLAAADKKLRGSSRFEPLLHVAWRQPTFERGQAIPVMLYEGMDIPPAQTAPIQPGAVSPESATDALIRNLQTQTPARPAGAEDTRIGAMNPRLVGTVELSVSRYLHLKTDLFFRRMMPQYSVERVSDGLLWFDTPYPTLRTLQGPAYQRRSWYALRGIELEESRRMRSSEIHYLDHPLFGVVALITPYEIAKPPVDDGEIKVLPPPAALNR